MQDIHNISRNCRDESEQAACHRDPTVKLLFKGFLDPSDIAKYLIIKAIRIRQMLRSGISIRCTHKKNPKEHISIMIEL